MVTNQLFIAFEHIVDDRTKTGSLEHGWHPAAQGAGARGKMRKLPACARASFVDHAQVPIEENATIFCVAQNSCGGIVWIGSRVLTHDISGFGSQVTGYSINIKIRHTDESLAAAIGARRAIDLFFHGSTKNAKWPFRIVVGGQFPLEREILFPVQGGEPADLH